MNKQLAKRASSRKRIGRALMLAGLCAQLSLLPAPAGAQPSAPFTLVKDVNTTAQSADGINGEALFVPVGNTVFFTAATRETGKELWRTDGTEAGTQLIKDINPGERNAIGYYGGPALALGSGLLITADDGALGDELWYSDGTAAGTILLKDTWPGAAGGTPQSFRVLGKRAFFSARIGETQQALWITDGTAAGTTLLKTFTGLGSLRVMGNSLYFSAAEAGNNSELWKSDGTAGGTVAVKEIRAGQDGSNPNNLVEIVPGQLLLFSADDGVNGREMWRSDGTAQGTQMVRDIRSGALSSAPDNMAPIEAFFGLPPTYYSVLFAANDGAHGAELWVTDGFGTTQLVVDAYAGAISSDPGLLGTNFCTYPTFTRTCPFFAMTDATHGRELWIADGMQGMVLLKDIYPGNGWGSPSSLVKAGSAFYFTADTPTSGQELWKTDGTPQGTQPVADIYDGQQNSYPRELTAFGDAIYFTADDGARGRELWRSDGTAQGTTLLRDIGPDTRAGVERVLGVALGALYFTADDGAAGLELWKTDGTPTGTVRVKNIAPDIGQVDLDAYYNAAALGDRLAFGLPVGPSGTASGSLWVSDGTAAGTTAIRSFPAVDGGGQPYALTTLGDGALFGAIDNKDVLELWRTDGTPGGTGIITNTVKPYFGYVGDLTRLNDRVIFATRTSTSSNAMDSTYAIWSTDGTPQGTKRIKTDVSYGYPAYAASGNTVFFGGSLPDKIGNLELWKTDGTSAGTQLVKEINSGDQGSDPNDITPGAPGSVFFIAYQGAAGYTLWKSDGTEAGTVNVHDVRPSESNYEYGELAYVGSTLYFAANDGASGSELWKSDGTGSGTTMVADIYPGVGSSSPEDFIGLNGVLYFSATGPDGKRTLWRSDGTAMGTRPIRGDAGAPLNPYNQTIAQGQLLFSAADVHGREVWRSDGTAAGTTLLQDIAPGPDSSDPQPLISTGRNVFLTASTPGIGRELWSMPLGAAPTPSPGPSPGPRRVLLPVAQR